MAEKRLRLLRSAGMWKVMTMEGVCVWFCMCRQKPQFMIPAKVS